MSEIYMRCLDFHEATDASYIRGYTHASPCNTISEDGCIIDLYIKYFIVVSCSIVAEIRYEGERYEFFLSKFFFFFTNGVVNNYDTAYPHFDYL